VDHDFHATDGQLEQYALGRLSTADLPPVEEHLLICSACQERLTGIGDFAIGMREALSLPGPDPEDLPEGESESFALPRKGPGRASWLAWMRRPAVSMALGFAGLLLTIAIFSSNRTNYAPTAALLLTATRGEMPVAVPAREFDLTLTGDNPGPGPFRVKVVNAMAVTMWSGLAEGDSAGARVRVQQRLAPGDYFVQLYSASGALLHEYGFRVRL
jgi:hypothetical protein